MSYTDFYAEIKKIVWYVTGTWNFSVYIYWLQILVQGNFFFKMTRNVWSDFVNVSGEVFDWYTKLVRYTIRYTTFLVCRRYKYVLESMEMSVKESVYDKEWLFLTGIHPLYGLVVYK